MHAPNRAYVDRSQGQAFIDHQNPEVLKPCPLCASVDPVRTRLHAICRTCGCLATLDQWNIRRSPAPITAALRELVTLKDMKDTTNEDEATLHDYQTRKPLAWDAARAALAEELAHG